MRYNSIIYNDTANGEGMRISFFVQGCRHHCKNCFNKEIAWDFNGGYELTQEVLNDMFFNLNLYQQAYDGITILGGEPFHNLDVINLIIDNFKKQFPNKTIWIYSGYTYEELLSDSILLNTLNKCDILVDGKFVEELKDTTLLFRGSSNQRIIDIQKSLKENKVILYLN